MLLEESRMADLAVSDLVVGYGPVRALRGVSMRVPSGSIVAVLGANGAGKSTLLRAISGTLRFHRGSCQGTRDAGRPAADRAAPPPPWWRAGSSRCPRDGGCSPG